ncbi:AraC family transcriptional regulator [Tichowtungia aerotolerans]|nr:helix-turn-helix transcriptional regulator [Tichowtungia aerotolerans]
MSKETSLPPVETGFIEDSSRPVISYCAEVKNAVCAASHAHPRAQVIFANRGVMRVITKENTWLVPPAQAVWIPSQVQHQVYFPGAVSIRNLFIDSTAAASLPEQCMVFNVTPLLRELILRVGETEGRMERSHLTARLMQVILDELQQIKPARLNLPMSDDVRLHKIMVNLIHSPDDNRTLDEWAQTAGAVSRTLSRLFLRETGMTFGEWRTRLRLLEAIDRLSQGQSVTQVAFDLGYQNLSAFIAMFRKTLGTTPGRFFQTLEKGRF